MDLTQLRSLAKARASRRRSLVYCVGPKNKPPATLFHYLYILSCQPLLPPSRLRRRHLPPIKVGGAPTRNMASDVFSPEEHHNLLSARRSSILKLWRLQKRSAPSLVVYLFITFVRSMSRTSFMQSAAAPSTRRIPSKHEIFDASSTIRTFRSPP